MNPFNKIQARIDNTPELEKFADLLQYEWEDEDEHAEWVATAPTAEIVDWAEQIRDAEQMQAEIDEITDPANW
ncbi:MAG: hypothetical protein KDD89_10480 [Anaerolineales bacterium]|nr:hypothetical protein [Anaerolineales bacterium]